jgi:autotransporter-associated beta strand protein
MRAHRAILFFSLLCVLLGSFQAAAQAPNSAWVYPSATGNLLYQLDSRGQRINDFSQCGYRGGTEPLPNVTALIPQSRWVYVSPGSGDDTALIQAAIDSVEAMTPDANGWRGVVYLNAGEYQLATTLTIQANGVVMKGAGDSSTTGTRLRATDARQYTLISATNSTARSTVSGTTRNLTQKLVPAGTRTFEVDSTSGLAVGHTVIVKRPSPANWIADIDMDQLGAASGDPAAFPWTAGSKDLSFDRTITRINGNWITVDIPLPQTFESQYDGGQIWRYTWSGRLQQVGIEDIYGFSDYASSTDEAHGWTFISMGKVQNGWVRNITAQYFGYSAVTVSDGAKWVTVADSQCLDPISIIDGGRRYSFNNDGGECCLFVNNYARKGRHDFVFGSVVPGPNVFVHSTADTVYSDSGPHQRWSVGGLFDDVTINGNALNVENRGNLGTGHGWTGAYMTVWNCEASAFHVRNPPTARNWLVGSIGTVAATSNYPIGADPAGTYDSSGPSGTGKAVYPRSLYYGQLQQRMKWPSSEFREVWLNDVDQLASTTFGDPVNCDATWLSQVEAIDALPAFAKFDYLAGSRYIACTLDLPLDPGDTVVAASLTVSLRAVGSATSDSIWLDSTTSPQSFASLGWTPISTTAQTVRTMEVSPSLLTDGRLNVALGTNCAVDFVVLHVQVQKAQPGTTTITLNPVADALVTAGVNAGTNYGTSTALTTKDDTNADFDRETFLRWDLSSVSGKIVQAKVRLAGIAVGQAGNENCATFVSDDTWGETTINFTNKPASGKLFAQWLPITGQAVEFTVTPQVVDALLGDGKLSLSLLSTGAYGANGIVNYASRENATAANRPQLILTVDPSDSAIKAATGSTLNVSSAWTGAFVPVDPDTAIWNSTSLAGTMMLGANLNWAGLIVNNPAGALTFNGPQTLTLGSGGIDMSAATVDLTLNHPVILGQNQPWNVGAGRTLAANGQISGAWDLTKTGPGSLILSAAETYTGTTDIDQGTVVFTANNSLDGGLTFGANGGSTNTGALDLTSANATFGNLRVQTNTAGNNTITIGSGKTLTFTGSNVNNVISVGSSGSAKLQVTGATGTLTVTDPTRHIVVATTSGSPATTQTLDLSGLGTFNATIANLYVGNPRSFSGAASTGAANNDILTLAGNNTITASDTNGIVVAGATSTGGGGTQRLRLGTTNVLNATRFVIGGSRSNGALEFNTGLSNPTVNIRGATGGSSRTNIYLGDQAITLGGSLYQSGGGSTSITGTMNFTGGTVNARIDNLIVGMGGGSSATKPSGNGNITMDGLSSLVDINTLVIARGVSGSGNGTASTGTFTVTNGTLQVNTAMTLANDTALNSSGSIQNLSATFTVAGGNATIGSVSTPVNLLLGNHVTAGNPGLATATVNLTGGTLTVFGNIQDGNLGAGTINSSLTLNGATLDMKGRSIGSSVALIDTLTFASGTLQNVAGINNGAGLTKTTSGTLVLAGTNTYSGTTTVSAGSLALSGSLMGAVTVNSGTFAPLVLPTASGALTLNAGGTFQARITGSTAGIQYDQLAAGGSVTLGGSLDLVPGPGLAAGASFRILNKTSPGVISGTFAGKQEGSAFTEDGYTWIISYLGGDGNDVVLTLATPAQAWRFQYFGTVANSGTAADTFDANGDGELNILEYATAQNPTAASLVTLATIRTVSTLDVTYTRSKAALNGGVNFMIEWSDTLALGSWTSVGVTQTVLTDNGTVQTVKAVIPAGTGKRFSRLKVTDAP